MLDKNLVYKYLRAYKKSFSEFFKAEKYKWEAIKCFHENWEIHAVNFPDMLKAALAKTLNLLVGKSYFPLLMIQKISEQYPEDVRTMFIKLFDESTNIVERYEAFKVKTDELHKKGKFTDKKHFQDEHAISVYLTLRYPEIYNFYKYSIAKDASSNLGGCYIFKKGDYTNNIADFIKFSDEVYLEISSDKELYGILMKNISDECYNDSKLRVLSGDFIFYVAVKGHDSIKGAMQYWWLNANPKIWSLTALPVGDEQKYTIFNENGRPRRIHQNFLDINIGDKIIGYETTPIKQVVALAKVTKKDNETISFEKVENLTTPIDYSTLKACPELEQLEYFSNNQGSLFRVSEDEYAFIMDLIREENPLVRTTDFEIYSKEDFLNEVYMSEAQFDRLVNVLRRKSNIILQGPPGVGKTYAAKRLAYALMGEKDESRIEFVQFHQNYTYEDFVMGYRPASDGFELCYGIFHKFCERAANQPEKEFFFIIDEINRGNISKVFGELLLLIEHGYRGTNAKLAYSQQSFSVPKNLFIIGMMNTADRSLALIDYALRRRFSFIDLTPGFESYGFSRYRESLGNAYFDTLIQKVVNLNERIREDSSLGKGFCIGHSYFCGIDSSDQCTPSLLKDIIEFDIMPLLEEYWFDDVDQLAYWEKELGSLF